MNMKEEKKFEEISEHYSIIFLYGAISFIFFMGSWIYQMTGIYSEQLILLTIQVVIYGLIINVIIATAFLVNDNKQTLVIANFPMLVALYYNLVFQIYNKIDTNYPKVIYITSIVLAMVFLLTIIMLTSKRHFTEKIWSIAIYFSLTTVFDLDANKYFTALFAIIVFVNLSFKIEFFTQEKAYKFLKGVYPKIDKMSVFNPFSVYVTIYTCCWCCIYYWLTKCFKDNISSLISLGFIIPNIALIIQYTFSWTYALFIGFVFYFLFNLMMLKAQIYANNVVSDPEIMEKIDIMLEEIHFHESESVRKFGSPTGILTRSWRAFKNVVTGTVNAGGGAKNWGKITGGLVGFTTTTYFGLRYLGQRDQQIAIDKEQMVIAKGKIVIAREQLEAQDRAIAAQLEANKLAEEANKLLSESNKHAAENCNKIAVEDDSADI